MADFWAPLLRKTWRKWRDEQSSRQGAALAFYGMFSLAPMLLLWTWAMDPFLGDLALVDLRSAQLGAMMPDALVASTEILVDNIDDVGKKSSVVLALFALIYAPTRGFLQLQGTLNQMWGVLAVRGPGPLNMLRRKGWAMLSVGSTFALISGTLVLNGLWLTASNRAEGLWDLPGWVLFATDGMGATTLLFLCVVAVFKTLPDVEIRWKTVLVGSFATTSLLVFGRFVVTAYLLNSSRALAFGAASSIIALMLFAYYAAQMLLLGAAFTCEYAAACGDPIRPGPGAVRVERVRHEGLASET